MAGRYYLLILLVFSQQVMTIAQHPDLILSNGKIFTSLKDQPFVEAIAITDDLITATGKSAEIEFLAGPGTRLINLAGRTVIPGINDAHYHFTPQYQGHTITLSEKDDGNRQVLLKKIRDAAAALQAGEFIYVTLGVQSGTDTLINRKSIDEVSPKHPVVLEGFWGHTIILNSRALSYFKIDESTVSPEGGNIGKTNGVLNGWFWGNACNLVRFKKPVSEENFRKGLEKLGMEAGYFGITTIQNICSNADTSRFARALSDMSIPVKLRLIHWGTYTEPQPDTLPRRFNPLVKKSGLKYLVDGTPIEGNALIKDGYHSRPFVSSTHLSQSRLSEIIMHLNTSGEQPLFHVVGDSAINMLIEAVENLGTTLKSRRVRIEHGDGLFRERFDDVKDLNMVVVINPSHSTVSKMPSVKLKGRFLHENSPAASLVRKGIHMAIGSDGLLNPYLNIMFAVTHPDEKERLTREEAVIAYTKESAFAEHEDRKGVIAKGMIADLAVLNADLFTIPVEQLPAIHSTLTILNGRIIYRAGYKKGQN